MAFTVASGVGTQMTSFPACPVTGSNGFWVSGTACADALRLTRDNATATIPRRTSFTIISTPCVGSRRTGPSRLSREGPAAGFGNPPPARGGHQKGRRTDRQGGAEAVRLGQRAHGERRRCTRDPAGVVGQALRRGADRSRINLRRDGAEARVVAGREESDERAQQQERQGR